MKCAHPTCQRGIGLVSHRRSWFGKRLYCSRACRDNYLAEAYQPRPSRPSRAFDPSLLDRLPTATVEALIAAVETIQGAATIDGLMALLRAEPLPAPAGITVGVGATA